MRAYQQNGIELGWLKSANESWTRVVVYISLMAVYILGGSKVKSVSTILDLSCLNDCNNVMYCTTSLCFVDDYDNFM